MDLWVIFTGFSERKVYERSVTRKPFIRETVRKEYVNRGNETHEPFFDAIFPTERIVVIEKERDKKTGAKIQTLGPSLPKDNEPGKKITKGINR